MAPTLLPNYQENFNNLVTKANELNRKTFENRFQQFQRVEHKINEPKNYQTFLKRKEFRINGKFGTAGQGD